VPAPAPRLAAVDAVRGLVMVLMTLDHASSAFNAGRLTSDSARGWVPGTALDPRQFATRWVTHLCAPTFVFLAGLSISLSAERRRRQLAERAPRGSLPGVSEGRSSPSLGEARGAPDWFLLRRGIFIAACDPLWMSWVFGVRGKFVFQVLYAIGVGFVAMAALRRLPPRWLGALALGTLLGHEALARELSGGTPGPLAALLVTGGAVGPVLVAYPVLPWLAVMALGHAAGALVPGTPPERLAGRTALAGAVALSIFVVVRGVDGYGNLGLHRDGSGLVQWLHVSKYPPSLSYAALELGIMAILLAVLLRVPPSSRGLTPLVLLGQTAFFFYLIHVYLLLGAAHLLGMYHAGGLPEAYAAAVAAVGVLLPLCAVYRRYKAAHPEGWARYV
jgi:uncharacterized membrane protein